MVYRTCIALSLAFAFMLLSGFTALGQTPQTTQWTAAQTNLFVRDATNTIPDVVAPRTPLIPGFWIWDSWPLRTRDGQVANVNGWVVWMSLTAPNSVLPGKRHDLARIRYLASRDGVNWIPGGLVFPEEQALGSRNWASDAIYNPDTREVIILYTATGDATENCRAEGEESRCEKPITYVQRIAWARGRVTADTTGVTFSNWQHKVILEPDGMIYQTPEQSGGQLYAFRDPFYFRDPRTGRQFLLFEANTAVPGRTGAVPSPGPGGGGSGAPGGPPSGPPGLAEFNGAVGIAEAVGDNPNLDQWRLLPPLLTANAVNQELERPHFVYHENAYYLFIDTHIGKFAPGTTAGPEGLYGWRGENLLGPYTPLNGSALVLGNPNNPTNRFQSYSWFVLPDLSVTSFLDTFDLPEGVDLGNLPQRSAEFQKSHFGGTFMPLWHLAINGTRTEVVSTDANGDGITDYDDVFAVLAFGGLRQGQAGYRRDMDMNRDNVIDITDLSIIARYSLPREPGEQVMGVAAPISRPIEEETRGNGMFPPGRRAGAGGGR